MPIGAKQDLIRPFGAPSPKGKARKMPFFLSFRRSRTPTLSTVNFPLSTKKSTACSGAFFLFQAFAHDDRGRLYAQAATVRGLQRVVYSLLQVAYTRKLQLLAAVAASTPCAFKSPMRASCNNHSQKPWYGKLSFKSPMRASCNARIASRSVLFGFLQVAYARKLQR